MSISTENKVACSKMTKPANGSRPRTSFGNTRVFNQSRALTGAQPVEIHKQVLTDITEQT
jgi:hypothetical protein